MTGNAVPAWTEQPTPFAITPEPWMADGVCAETGGDMFFETATIDAARRICNTCPVADLCLEYAMRNGEKEGVWGGLSANQRARLRRKENAA